MSRLQRDREELQRMQQGQLDGDDHGFRDDMFDGQDFNGKSRVAVRSESCD